MVKGTKPEQNEKLRENTGKERRHKLDPIHVQQMRHHGFFFLL